ncbi:Pyridoxal-5'-phosphate-dependent protein beta subunit [Halalkalicoccus jeotgali B3]|uniref:Pyridoxal-5'-phosphate-dependent protein beta subunit n=2 Tax=Halalkalicoccus jeotgali (strain DSM 18796 / CECT 7217 / JCM 14584 / KCTC 4019 / B3) TaxID=795797 RepID=D8J5D0_HALJB|nr:PLP-dependent cysteine synthase family protein [Halalkalicoccus jeotgali]ADJ15626.1 Pyridoxal-5'-phosphate-dependent protein beta subunit [Halalkalicoccus jeotgali B3]
MSAPPAANVLETVGRTPLVSLGAAPESVPVYAKLESFNPGASVKDRIGKYMLEAMLDRGAISPGGTVIEPTAGNTGIGIAVAAGQLDLDAVFVVPERFSVEKQQLMAALGAEVINTPTSEGMGGAIERAHELADELEDSVVPQQFSNPLNTEAHYETTAPEIYGALEGAVGAVVAGCGTAGTLMGLARYARERDSDTYVGAVEPEGSLYATTKGIDGEEGEYKTEGIGTHDPATNELFEPDLVDEVLQVSDRDAHDELKRLAREEGHLVASSAGAASVAARRVAARIETGELEVPYDSVVTVFPDSSERYLSKGIYREFEEWDG